MTLTLSRAIREAAEEIARLRYTDPKLISASADGDATIITKHLAPILSPPAGDEAKMAVKKINELRYSGIDASQANEAMRAIIQLAISQAQAPLVERVKELEELLHSALSSVDSMARHNDGVYAGNVRQDGYDKEAARIRQALTPKEPT